MSIVARTLGVTLALGLVHLAAKAKAAKLRARPDLYSFDVLAREPQGDEVWIDRPDGTRLRAVHRGAGTTVVLAHGYGMSLVQWNVIWDLLLDAGYRVIAFDQRGHGGSTIGADGIGSASMAGDYRAILEHFDVRDGILVGHSMGGFVGMVFLLEHAEVVRERLRGAVLMATFAGDVYRGAPQTRLQVPLIKSGVMDRIARSETYGVFFGASLMGDEPFPAAIDAFNRIYLEQAHDRLVPILDAFARESRYPRLGEIRLPCVVVCGDRDHTTPTWHSRRMGAEIPGARNVWVPGKGHMLNWEAPGAIVEAVESLR